MRLSAIASSLALLLSASIALADPPIVISHKDAEALQPRLQDELICGPDKPPRWPAPSAKKPRFTLGSDGVLGVDPTAPATTLRLCGDGLPSCRSAAPASTQPGLPPDRPKYARLERARPNGGDPEILACGPLPHDMAGGAFDVAALGHPAVQSGDQLTVLLFDDHDQAAKLVELTPLIENAQAAENQKGFAARKLADATRSLDAARIAEANPTLGSAVQLAAVTRYAETMQRAAAAELADAAKRADDAKRNEVAKRAEAAMHGRFARSLVQYRQKPLLEAQQIERDALHRLPSIQALSTVVRTAIASSTAAAFDSATSYMARARTEIQQHETHWRCSDVPAPSSLLGPAICDEVLALGTVLASIEAQLAAMKAAPSHPSSSDLEKLGGAVAALKPSTPENPDVEIDQCARLDRLRWLYLDRTDRLIARASLPIVPDVVIGAYGKKIAPVDAASTTGKRALVVTAISASERTLFAEKEGDRVTLELPALIGGFVSAAIKAGTLPPLYRAPQISAGDARLKAVAAALNEGAEKIFDFFNQNLDPKVRRAKNISIPSLVCRRENPESWTPDHPLQFKMDGDLPSASGLDSRSYIFGPLGKDKKLSVALCAGDACSAADDDKAVKTRVTLTPSRAGTWTLVAELSGGVALRSWAAGNGGFDVMSPPSFQPVLGVTGPDQVFELQQTADPRNVISTALLLAFRPADRWMIGLGPTLLVGSGGGAFSQWNLHFGRELTRGVFVTWGFSVRAVPFPRDYAVGDRVSVPRGTSDPKAPGLNTYFSPVIQLDLGFGFDLAALGGITSDIYKAVGGGK